MDVMDFKWEPTGQNVLCPQVKISFRLVDSDTRTTTIEDLRDSEGKSVLFPNIVSTMPASEKQELMKTIVEKLVSIYIARNHS
jgi:hypothetical protein